MTTPVFKLRSVYSFELFPASILGAFLKNATVTGVLDEESARKYINTRELHAAVYPSLPNGTPNDPAGYDYVKLKTQTGETSVLGIAWIKPDTVVEIDSRVIVAKISGVSASDVNRVRNALLTSGFNNITIDLL